MQSATTVRQYKKNLLPPHSQSHL
jgi:hypothetical protein